MHITRTIYFFIFISITVSCKDVGITVSELNEKISISKIETLNYYNDSLRNEVHQIVPQILLFKSIPIKTPDFNYSLSIQNDTVQGINYFHTNRKVDVNKVQLNVPNIKLKSY